MVLEGIDFKGIHFKGIDLTVLSPAENPEL